MSIVFSTVCLDCGVFAPEVGDFGYIGYPSLDTSRGPDCKPPNFGYLYEAFAGIQLVTWHLDLLHGFFRSHAGHRLHTFADDEPLFGDGGPNAMQPDPGEVALLSFGLQEAAWTEAAAARYPLARFKVQCGSCAAEYLSSASDNLRRFDLVTLTLGYIRQFGERMKGQLDRFIFMKASPLDGISADFTDLSSLLAFLTDHGAHGLTASMVLDA
jgi:hypothetical protein